MGVEGIAPYRVQYIRRGRIKVKGTVSELRGRLRAQLTVETLEGVELGGPGGGGYAMGGLD